jgi:hypothetical protein
MKGRPQRPDTLDFLGNARNHHDGDWLTCHETREPSGQPTDPWLFQRQMPSGWMFLGLLMSKDDVRIHLAIGPGEAPAVASPFGLAAVRLQVAHGHALDPIGQRVREQALGLAGSQIVRRAEN